ncbi:uncharacterized protein LOC62_05G007581 [Vanrija pseudolonga]|uniref:Secreted protein n=1 Tax=Vanrija pseudolonga TaxID=143232 RepID=A0AAF1BSX8_9TREE|nr:hypothetical protein LOC62_05G007581 [Vanrija pseudolonga]
MHPPRNLAIAQWLLAAITVLWATTTCRSLCSGLAHAPLLDIVADHGSAAAVVTTIDVEGVFEAAAGWRPALGDEAPSSRRLPAPAAAAPATPASPGKATGPLDPHLAQVLRGAPRRNRSPRPQHHQGKARHHRNSAARSAATRPTAHASTEGYPANDVLVPPPVPSWT